MPVKLDDYLLATSHKHCAFTIKGLALSEHHGTQIIKTPHPPLSSVGVRVRVRVRVNPNPMEGWVNSLQETVIDPIMKGKAPL